jgi:hypothetical protein
MRPNCGRHSNEGSIPRCSSQPLQRPRLR